jgi:hypothetical protein
MRIARFPVLAGCLSIGSLAAWAACGGTLDAAAAVLAPGAAAASQCQALPAPSSGATPSASASASSSPTTAASATPADLCVSVEAAQASIQAGQAGTWTVRVWAENGPVTGVTVTLSGTGGQPTFTGKCPRGDGSASCAVGDLATDVAASSYQLQAQITVPSGTAAGSTVTLSASADATPPLPVAAAAAVAVGVTAPPPTASASASPSAPAASKSAAPSASRPPATRRQVTRATTPQTTLPGIGTIPSLVSPAGSPVPPTTVTAIADPASISSLLPVITPEADATSPTAGLQTSAVAVNPASAGFTADRAGATRSVFVIPTATAEAIGLVVLLVFVALAARLRAANKLLPRVQPGRASRGAHGRPFRTRRLKPASLLHLRRQRSDSPKKTHTN